MPDIEELAHAFVQDSAPPERPDTTYQYVPSLTPEQLRFYNSEARFVLAYGERFSGKTYVAAHKIVKHCWEEWNAQAIVVVAVRRQATDGGILHTLVTEILPEWSANQPGFEHSEMKQDAASKDLYIWIKNKWGAWGQVKLVSMPHGNNISERVRGTAPSMIYVDELTKMDGSGFFHDLMMQLGRRPHIAIERQQWVSTTNPDGPSHWAHKAFFVDNKLDDGSADPRYDVIHLPIGANPTPRARAYFDQVMEATKHNPVEYRRLVLGEWVDLPSGTAIFRDHFFESVHVKGDLARREFLVPRKGFPLTVGYDLGDRFHSVIFMQTRPVEDRQVTVVFDEINVDTNGVSFDILVPAILEKMNWWCEHAKHSFVWEHISDKSAFNRFRAASGSYDHLQVQRISKELLEANPEKYPWLKKPIRMIPAPKPPGSVAGRIKALMNLLGREEIFFSAKVQRLIKAIANIESEEGEPFEPSRSGDHIHCFDALTYPIFYHALGKPPPVEDIPSASTGILVLGGRN